MTKFMINKDGATFYLNGNTWFRPAYGANVRSPQRASAPRALTR